MAKRSSGRVPSRVQRSFFGADSGGFSWYPIDSGIRTLDPADRVSKTLLIILLAQIYDFLRYATLALFPGHEYEELAFLLCDYG